MSVDIRSRKTCHNEQIKHERRLLHEILSPMVQSKYILKHFQPEGFCVRTQLWNEYQVGATSWRVFSVMSSSEE